MNQHIENSKGVCMALVLLMVFLPFQNLSASVAVAPDQNPGNPSQPVKDPLQAENEAVSVKAVPSETSSDFMMPAAALQALPELPAGWSRATSNAEFAYQVKVTPGQSGQFVDVKFRDLISNQEYVMPRYSLYGSEQLGEVDVAANGSYGLMKINGSSVRTQALHFASGTAGGLPDSNKDFLITGTCDGVCRTYLFDMRSQVNHFVDESYGSMSRTTVRDISPDGLWAVIDYGSYNPENNKTAFYSLKTSKNEYWTSPCSFEFAGENKVIVKKGMSLIPYFWGLVMTTTTEIDLEAKKERNLSYQYHLTPAADSLKDGVFLFQLYNTMYLFDASRGMQDLRLLRGNMLITSQTSNPTIVDWAYQKKTATSGQLLVLYSVAADGTCSAENSCSYLSYEIGGPPTVTGAPYNAGELAELAAQTDLFMGKGDVAEDNDSQVNLTQTSNSNFRFDYHLPDDSDFAFSGIRLASPQNLGPKTAIALKGPAGKQLKVEFKDINGVAAIFYANLDSVLQNFVFDFSSDGIPAGFDPGQITEIVFVADRVKSGGSGTVEVNVKGLRYSPVLNGAPYNPNDLTLLPVSPKLFTGRGDALDYNHPTSISLAQTSNSNFRFDYMLPDPWDFVFSGMSFQTPQNLGLSTTLALNGASGKRLKVEFKDENGKIALFYANLGGVLKNYTFSLSSDVVPAGFDASKIQEIVIVAEQTLSGPSGTIEVNVKGLNYTPVVSGSSYSYNALTLLPAEPSLFTGKGDSAGNNNSRITQTQTSNSNFRFGYNLPDADDFVFSGMSFPSAQNLGLNVTLGLNGPAGKQMKVEFKDINNKTAVYYVNLTGALKNYTFTLSVGNVPVGFDTGRITGIALVTEKSRSGQTGTIDVNVKGLNYTPVLTGISFNPRALTTLTGSPMLFTGKNEAPGNQNPVINQTQLSGSVFRFNYQLSNSFDYVFSGISFPASQNLGSVINLALKGPTGKQLKVEVKDVNGKAVVFYAALSGVKQNYAFPLSANVIPAGFDISKIASIALIAEPSKTGMSGTIEVETRGLRYPV